MNVVAVTLKKELISYFFSPVSYLILVLFYLYRGFEVHRVADYFAYASLDQDLFSAQYYSLGSTSLMIVLVPAILTMRCFADERRSGSLETLMTAPVRDWEIVLGKWLAAVAFYCVLWLPTIALLWVLTWDSFLGANLPFSPVLTAYFGMFLLSSMLLAVGCFTSSLTDNVLLASLAAIIFNYGLLSAPSLLEPVVREHWDNYYVREAYEKIQVFDHFGNWFARGLVDTSQVAFYVGGVAFFLFLTVLSLGSRRWR